MSNMHWSEELKKTTIQLKSALDCVIYEEDTNPVSNITDYRKANQILDRWLNNLSYIRYADGSWDVCVISSANEIIKKLLETKNFEANHVWKFPLYDFLLTTTNASDDSVMMHIIRFNILQEITTCMTQMTKMAKQPYYKDLMRKNII